MEGVWLIAFLIQWLLLLFLVLIIVGVLRQLRIMQERWHLAAPPITAYELGERIADFELPNAAGTQVQSNRILQLTSGGVILFVSSTCSSCAAVMAQVAELVTRSNIVLSKVFILIVVEPLEATDSLRKIYETYLGLNDRQVVLLADDQGDVTRQFGVRSVPTGIVVDKDGHVISQTFNPHAANWLYKVTNTPAPAEPASQGATSLRIPGIYARQEG